MYKKKSKVERDEALDVFGGLESPDIELLLDLLAEKMGVEVALSILTLLDDDFNATWSITLNATVNKSTFTFTTLDIPIFRSSPRVQ